jgi:hypothetical protein
MHLEGHGVMVITGKGGHGKDDYDEGGHSEK